jgi:hypothetical protein
MRKTTFSADRLSDLEITTCILRRPAPRSSSRSCSSSSTWWSSTAAIAAGVVLLVLAAAASGCLSDGEMDGDGDADTDTDDRDCETFAEFYCECWPDDCQVDDIQDECELESYEWWQCVSPTCPDETMAELYCDSCELYLSECSDL